MKDELIKKSELISYRKASVNDTNFILSSWIQGLYHNKTAFSDMEKDTFMKIYNVVLKFLIDELNPNILIACLRDEPDAIIGYSVLSASQTSVHWVFVRKSWRGIGIAKDLVPKTVIHATHLTACGRDIIKKQGIIKFNPFLLGDDINVRKSEISKKVRG